MNTQCVQVKVELGHRAVYRKYPTTEGFTHDWTVFVRGPEGCNIQSFVDKVVFNLHESFPKAKRVVKDPPYLVSESGYGGFLMSIDIYFKNKEEPKKISFEYDLFLNTDNSPPINHVRCEKLKFQYPTEDFRRKLVAAGGVCIPMPGEATQVTNPSANPEGFNDLFGPPIKAETPKKHKHKEKNSSGGSSGSTGSASTGSGGVSKHKSGKHPPGSSTAATTPSSKDLTVVATKEGTKASLAPSTPSSSVSSSSSSSSSSHKESSSSHKDHHKPKDISDSKPASAQPTSKESKSSSSSKRSSDAAFSSDSSSKKRKTSGGGSSSLSKSSKSKDEKHSSSSSSSHKSRDKDPNKKSSHKSHKKTSEAATASENKVLKENNSAESSKPVKSEPKVVAKPEVKADLFSVDNELMSWEKSDGEMDMMFSPSSNVSFSSTKASTLGTLMAELGEDLDDEDDDDNELISPLPNLSHSSFFPSLSQGSENKGPMPPHRIPSGKSMPEKSKTESHSESRITSPDSDSHLSESQKSINTPPKSPAKDTHNNRLSDPNTKILTDSHKSNSNKIKKSSSSSSSISSKNKSSKDPKEKSSSKDKSSKDRKERRSDSAKDKHRDKDSKSSSSKKSKDAHLKNSSLSSPRDFQKNSNDTENVDIDKTDGCQGEQLSNGMELSVLVEMQRKLLAMSNRQQLQEVVNLIEESGMYKISDTTFDFDLCALDKQTVKRLQICLEIKI